MLKFYFSISYHYDTKAESGIFLFVFIEMWWSQEFFYMLFDYFFLFYEVICHVLCLISN